MKQFSTILFLLFFGFNSYSQTQYDLNLSAGEKYNLADKELNRVYRDILREYKNDTAFIEKLKISQRLWVKFRGTELAMRFPHDRSWYGSMFPMCRAAYLESLTNERIETLTEYITPIPKGEGCSGSAGYPPDYDIVISQVRRYDFAQFASMSKLIKEFNTDKLAVRIFTVSTSWDSEDYPKYIYVSVYSKYNYESKLFKLHQLYNPEILNIDLSNDDEISFDVIFDSYKVMRKTEKLILNINELKKVNK